MPSQKRRRSFLDGEFHLPAMEEKILKFWRENRIFERSLAARKGAKTFVFFEGPPTANGKPGLHHILARAFKDVIPRFKTMRGFFVPRKGGWDTHGLPVEIEVEKQLGLKSKKEVERYGIAAFNRACRESVWKYKEEWERLTERMGFWIDLKHPYITYETDYIESLWWIISQIAKKKLLYQGHKVMPWCTRCGTALSSHELAQGYQEDTDESVYVKFKLKPGQKIGKNFIADDKTYILSWTTTPWTLPGNVALAVGEKIQYEIFRKSGENFIFAFHRFNDLFPEDYDKVDFLSRRSRNAWFVSGKDLVDLVYQPLFDVAPLQNEKSYRIYPADFVTTEDGTGVVHTAVMYGEDDYELGKKVGLPQHHTVDEQGRFTKEVEGLEGLYVKDKETDRKIFAHLERKGFLLKAESYTHEYPHCWRCGTPLLYYARAAWFVAMSKLRRQLLANNQKVHWVPEHVKKGRFGEWLKEAKDWNFSRERYWGTPLPVWKCEACGAQEVVGSIAELREKAVRRNLFLFMRHGEADSVVDGVVGPVVDTKEYTSRLTPAGKQQVEKLAKALTRKKIDVIVASPLARTKKTAEIISRATGAPVVFRDDIKDADPGIFHGKKIWEARAYREKAGLGRLDALPRGESGANIKKRMSGAFLAINEEYRGKTILVVGHADPLWILKGALEGMRNEEILSAPYPAVGELYDIDARPLPLDEEGNLNLHRPYLDEIFLKCPTCGGEMKRVKELCDVWYDSGAMPFAQWHYPFENRPLVDKRQMFPADYISEAVDQTRGWFYTLLAVSTLLGRGAPYRNVICLGHLNDKFGQKMSKSKGNVVDPWDLAGKYGMDAVRWYLYTLNAEGDQKNFDEQELAKTFRRVHLILYNSFLFWRTYADKAKGRKRKTKSTNVLDAWILARLAETTAAVTKNLERYEVREAALGVERLIDDLSRWYIRRSRRRLQKSEDKKDYEAASATLGHVLLETVKLMAPFNPFFSEALYRALGGRKESVHLDAWPGTWRQVPGARHLIKQMEMIRKIASDVLAKRAEAGIKVRQPLASLKINFQASNFKLEALGLFEILKNETNVKIIEYKRGLKELFVLDTKITPALREEGLVREFVRTVAELRAKANLKPSDKIILFADLPPELQKIISKNEEAVAKETNSELVEYKRTRKFAAEEETRMEEYPVWLGVKKV